MMNKKVIVEVSPESKAMHEQIAVLSSEVSRLQGEKESIEAFIADFNTNKAQYTNLEQMLVEINKSVDAKELILFSLEEKVTALLNKVSELQNKEIALQVSVDEKNSYVSNIESFKNKVVILQKEMEDFENDFSSKKIAHTATLETMKRDIIKVHQQITTLVNTL